MRGFVFGLIVVVLSVSMVAAFGSSGPAFAYDKEKPMVLKCGLAGNETEAESRLVKKLGDLVEGSTDGRIQFKYYYSSSLIKKPQLVDAVARGIADISIGPTSFLSGKIPDLSILEVYGTQDLSKFAAVQKAIDPILTEIMAKQGIHHALSFNAGNALFPHRTKFLKKPADWKGQKMRTPGRWGSTLAKVWGASPVFTTPAELYLSLQRGVIDGFMLPWHLVHPFKLYEVAPYIVDTHFSCNGGVVTMNLKKWNALTDEDKALFKAAEDKVKIWSNDEMPNSRLREREDCIAKGAKVYDLTMEEQNLYLKDADALWPEVRKVSGPLGNKLIDTLENLRKR